MVLPPAGRPSGLHLSELMESPDCRADPEIVKITAFDVPFAAAVSRVHPVGAAIADALNVAAAEPVGTTTLGGTESEALLLETLTAVLLTADLDRVTVHRLLAPTGSDVGVQLSEETVAAATRLMLAVKEVPLNVAVIVAF
jgi:hypothetical protein